MSISIIARSQSRWALSLLMSLCCVQGGCKKKQQAATQAPQNAQENPSAKEALEPASNATDTKAKIEQIPDPAAIKQAAARYWQGQYEPLVSALESAMTDWNAPNKQRAAGLAHGWIALAHAEQLPENAQEHIKQANEIAKTLDDADVHALSQIAHALSLVGMSEAQKAQAVLEALKDPADPELQRLLHIARAKTSINLAFDAQERLAHPEKLDQAEQSYRRVRPHQAGDENAVMGHVYEGMAAIAKFRGKMKQMCEQAKKAQEAYKEGGASELLQSGPAQMLSAGRCK